MEKCIKSIKGTIPHTNTSVDIELNGRNLIITGANGAGKTSLVKTLYELLFKLLNKHLLVEGKIKPVIANLQELINLFDEKKAIFKFYEEKRLSEINQPKIGQQINTEENIKLGNDLEQHLLNLRTRQSFAISMDKNEKLANDIQSWFDDFENNLKILFEDDYLTLKLNLEVENPHFLIIQKDKPPFTFQTLSAGYRAIFDIYADLLMHTEYFKIMPNELTGVVFIDEIDSHLHVSLQRLILPFFTQSFPKIQFIVTTHSPFVIMSTPDTVVYDLAKNELITDDLSYYTYSAVMEGLWDVKPIAAWVEQKIKEIDKIIHTENKDIQQLKKLVNEIKGREDGLDSESKAIFLLGKQTLLKEERKNV
jgi:predicted ATP-binding protein involved in virulence